MSENQQNSTTRLVLLLSVVLIAALGVQTYYIVIVRLHKKLDSAITPVASVAEDTSWSVRPLAATPPAIQSPGRPMLPLLFQDDDDSWANPFSELSRMHNEMNRLFGDSFLRLGGGSLGKTMAPRLDLSEEDDYYVVQMELPGADKANVNIKVKDRMLTVSGKNDEAREEEDDQGRVLRRERRTGNFERSLTLPGDVDAVHVEATYENGVLVITIPKAETEDQKPHEIEIK